MFAIDVSIDPATDKNLRSWGDDVWQGAVVDALNVTVEAARLHVVKAMGEHLDRPTTWMRNSWRVGKARAVPGRVPDALLLASEASSEIKTASSTAVSTAPAPRGRRSLPQGYVRRMLQQPDVAWVTLHPGEPRSSCARSRAAAYRSSPHRDGAVYKSGKLPLHNLAQEAIGEAIGRVNTTAGGRRTNPLRGRVRVMRAR